MFKLICGIIMISAGIFQRFYINEENADKWIKNMRNKSVEEAVKTRKNLGLLWLIAGSLATINAIIDIFRVY
ncbi:Uncharacterised protein [Sebaldella termitidis]|jgi:hypothetical protein|uniref:Uncharacterized protein n=1 Tax=Sebaldella termitidis (strain ATCC 33386 / NCTC 11300) TaxID=526218 RepID=D1AND2_SEBTE|nr:hypothetical protein [Sebaldella termitidis]ACZ09736.1 hypothetical protein Sterm_2892 [Sebaldella termitidis ATCC 33386]SUI25067.1 Uncharacterised protein [Sebaldella termitidis]